MMGYIKTPVFWGIASPGQARETKAMGFNRGLGLLFFQRRDFKSLWDYNYRFFLMNMEWGTIWKLILIFESGTPWGLRLVLR